MLLSLWSDFYIVAGWATWDPADKSVNVSLSGGNLVATRS